MMAPLRSFVRALIRRLRFEDDLSRELRSHIEERVADLVTQGLSPDAARRLARLEFGSSERVREECREARGLRWPDQVGRNLRFGMRLLRKDPVFACAAIATLALCIGANTAVFSLVDAVLFRPLPYPESERLAQVVVAFAGDTAAGQQSAQTGRVWEAVRDGAPALAAAVSSDWVAEVTLAGRGRVEQVRQQRVSATFFHVLGVRPHIGRAFTSDEDRPGGPPAVVLSHDLWRSAFNADASILGSTVLLRGESHAVVGVMPPGFVTSNPADVWTPLRPSTTGEGGGANYSIVARLTAGATWVQADTQLAAIDRDVLRESDVPRGAETRLRTIPLQAGMAAALRPVILLVWAAVGIVLLIGCVNVAGLLLARSARRTQELATRMALGGGRKAVVGQLLTESLLLASFGGLAGVAVGYATIAAVRPTIIETLGVWQAVTLDVRVLLATVAVSVLTSVIFGLLPAVRAARLDVRSVLLEGGGRTVAGGSRRWSRRLLVVGQAALGFALLVGAGLLVRSFATLNSQPAGFEPSNLLTASVSLQDARYRTADRVNELFERSLVGIHRVPGIEAAGVMLALPYERPLNLGFRALDGRTESLLTSANYVTPGVFDALGMVMRDGRQIRATDGRDTTPVVVVNETFVRRYYPGRRVIGERLRVSGAEREVIGIVRDVPQKSGWGDFGPLAPTPSIYLPTSQLSDAMFVLVHTWFSPRWVARTRGVSVGLAERMRGALAAADPLLAMSGVRRIDEVRATSLAMERLRAQLLGGLAVVALVLTFVGCYGTVLHGVAERRREIGVRLALGATTSSVIRAIAGPPVLLAAAGVVLGTGMTVATVPLLQRLVWGVGLYDPIAFGSAAVLVTGAVLVAALVPASRAARIDPMSTLRAE